MSFKLSNVPYNKETLNTSVFNYPDEVGTLGRTNMNLSILINKDVKDPAKREEVYNHELGHKHQIEEGRLAYDDENVYYDKNGDGNMETHPRSKMDEGDSALAWESEVYNEQNNKPMTKFKLREGSGNPAPFANLTDRGLIHGDGGDPKKSTDTYSEYLRIGGVDHPVKDGEVIKQETITDPAHTGGAKKHKEQMEREGYETEYTKSDSPGHISSRLDLPTTPKQTYIPEEPDESKQYGGTYVPRKGLGKILGKYKTVKSESAEEAFVQQKRKGRLRDFENVDVRAKRKN